MTNTGSLIIISGTSGSGKTIALQVLEDIGYYCVDNLPVSMLSTMAAKAVNDEQAINNFAISIDSRNSDLTTDFNLEELQALDLNCQLIFLDADDSILLKRYSETRRKHPLTNKNTSLAEAITEERQILSHLADIADHKINTSSTTPHELRSSIRNFAAVTKNEDMTLQFLSFGFKYGQPHDADFVFDIRCLPNPHWDPELKNLSGLDQPVKDFLANQPLCDDMFQHIKQFIEHWLPYFIAENRFYMTVAIGCTGGQHRSVYLSSLLEQYFSNNEQISTQIRHREINL